MPKVYIMCGRICSGKSTYAEKLRKEHNAVLLSVDEITLALFGREPGEKLDEYVEKAEKFLYVKSLEIIEIGADVVLDWGFWTKAEREQARCFYGSRGVAYEFYYLDISPEEWSERMKKRNADILAGKTDAYYVDDGLAAKFGAIFEPPDKTEIDVWINA